MSDCKSIPTNPKFQDFTGKRFGRLVVTSYAGKRYGRKTSWYCLCDCGTKRTVAGSHLATGHSQSCGCLNRDRTIEANKTHGMRGLPEYGIWSGIVQRCTNMADHAYKNYGGRGITVCQRWRDSFAAFYADMGPRPSDKYLIDRKNNDGDYEKSNCRWATRIEQNRNRRNNHLITFQGETRCTAEWAELRGLKYGTLQKRLRAGWTAERALVTPVQSK